MDNACRIPVFAVDPDAVIPVRITDRIKRHAACADRFQTHQHPAVRMRNDHAVSVAVQQQVHNDRRHPLRARHGPVRRDVDHPAELVPDPDIAVVGVAHKVDRHAADQLRDPETGRHDLRVIRQPRIPPAAQIVEIILQQKRQASAHGAVHLYLRFPFFHDHPRRGRTGRRHFSVIHQSSPHQAFAFFRFSDAAIIRRQAKTEASNKSILSSGNIFSYCTASSVFSMPLTFARQYSYASECR